MSAPSESKPRRGLLGGLRWFWDTRVASWWTVTARARRDAAADADSGHVAFARAAPDDFAATAPGVPAADGITAILTVYTRGDFLTRQIEALRAQSVPPTEIWVWCNEAGLPVVDRSPVVDRVVVSNANFSFWARFALAQMARTPWVAIYDDDVAPGSRWHESCLATARAGHDGILGGSGVVLPASGGYSSKHKVGWNGHQYPTATEVDLVGHAWMIPKRLVHAIWLEAPPSWDNGEDIHFSWMVRKHFGLATWVPPHPPDDRSVWSCLPEFGKRVSRSGKATHRSAPHHGVRDRVVDACRADGWRVVAERGAGSGGD